MSSRRFHNMVNFGPLSAEIGIPVWGTPAIFNGFRVLASLLHGSQVVGVSQALRHWAEGATYVWQGDHHVGHWAILVVLVSWLYRTNLRVFYVCQVAKDFQFHDSSESCLNSAGSFSCTSSSWPIPALLKASTKASWLSRFLILSLSGAKLDLRSVQH